MRTQATLLLRLLALAAASAAGASEADFIARMEREHAGDEPVPSPAAEAEPGAPVRSEEVTYARLDDRPVRGYLARPAAGDRFPGIVVIHEWWGLNENIRAVTRRLAGEGYAALAVDLYEGEAAADRENAARLARSAGERAPVLLENLRQAADFLRQTGSPSVGVIGWCFGGGWSLRTALALGTGIDATVIYYGRLVTEEDELAALSSPLLGIFGGQDQGIPVATVREFQLALDALGKEASIHIYEDADHAFANPSGTRYHAPAAADAWTKTVAFFARHLR